MVDGQCAQNHRAVGVSSGLGPGWHTGFPELEARRGWPGHEFQDGGTASAKARGQGSEPQQHVRTQGGEAGRQQPLPCRERVGNGKNPKDCRSGTAPCLAIMTGYTHL